MRSTGRRGFRLSEPNSISPEEPTLAREIVDVHRREHGYDIDELASLSTLPEREFREHMISIPRLRAV